MLDAAPVLTREFHAQRPPVLTPIVMNRHKSLPRVTRARLREESNAAVGSKRSFVHDETFAAVGLALDKNAASFAVFKPRLRRAIVRALQRAGCVQFDVSSVRHLSRESELAEGALSGKRGSRC